MHALRDSFAADDPINRKIWNLSCEMQKGICRRSVISQGVAGHVGAQQAMPKSGHKHIFGPENPLPWVPDLVGTQSGSSNSVLVVGSSYNGFIRCYSARARMMELENYAKCRNDESAGLKQFLHEYVESVVEGDEAYYQPILRDLLDLTGVPKECVCLTDLCKASFVERGVGPPHGCRHDIGNDRVLTQYWDDWCDYVCWPPDASPKERVPYGWIWRRMLQCSVIPALGSIAEYGIPKIFREMAKYPTACSQCDPKIKPNHKSLCPGRNWNYAYACGSRKLKDWLYFEDWWKPEANVSGRTRCWSLLTIFHPTAANGYKWDKGYSQTVPLVKRIISDSR